MKTYRPSILTRLAKNRLELLILLNFTLVNGVFSQTAATWGFNNTLSASTGSHITANAAGFSAAVPTLSFNSGTEYYGEGNWPVGVLNMAWYLEFSVAANSGYYLILNSLNMTFRRSNTGTPAGSGPTKWSLRSNQDNYTTDITSGSMTEVYSTVSYTLPAAIQAIPTSVTYRIYGYNASTSSGGNSRFVFDNIAVQGQAFAGTLAAQSILLTAKTGFSGNVALKCSATGFIAGTSFTLERSNNGIDFIPIYCKTDQTSQDQTGPEQADPGQIFQYNDLVETLSPASSSNLFYRVLAIEPGGAGLRSPIVVYTLTGNPAADRKIRGVTGQGSSLRVFLHMENSEEVQLIVRTSDGKTLSRAVRSVQGGDQALDLPIGACPHGIYILTLLTTGRSSGGSPVSRQFVY